LTASRRDRKFQVCNQAAAQRAAAGAAGRFLTDFEMTKTTRPLRIAMVAACPLPAERGTPSRILRMSEALADMGHEVHIVTYHLGTQVSSNGIAIHRIPNIPTYTRFSPGPTYQKVFLVDPILCAKLVRVILKHKIDLMHAHHFEGALVAFGARAATGRKVIYDAHTTLAGELHHYETKIPAAASRMLDGFVPRRADHVVAVSDDIATFVQEKGVSASRVTVIPTGVNMEDFEQVDSSQTRTRLGVGAAPLLVYTGGLAAFQGVSFLLAAMKQIAAAEPAARLVIVSADTDITYLVQEAEALGISDKTLFLTDVPFAKVPPYLACADVAVIPRIGCPGTPQKLGTYMAAKKAIVSFEGAAKLLRNGITGVTVPDGDIPAFAEAVLALFRDRERARRLGEAACEEIAREYSWPPLARRVDEVYQKLVPGDRAAS
jgi:glycosyltransferase involved in cell wall biosynthesis